eukprot:TCONS_00053793-protein
MQFFKRGIKSKFSAATNNTAELSDLDIKKHADFIRETQEELEKLMKKKHEFSFRIEDYNKNSKDDASVGSSKGSSTLEEAGSSDNKDVSTPEGRKRKTIRRSLSLPSSSRVKSVAKLPTSFTPRKMDSTERVETRKRAVTEIKDKNSQRKQNESNNKHSNWTQIEPKHAKSPPKGVWQVTCQQSASKEAKKHEDIDNDNIDSEISSISDFDDEITENQKRQTNFTPKESIITVPKATTNESFDTSLHHRPIQKQVGKAKLLLPNDANQTKKPLGHQKEIPAAPKSPGSLVVTKALTIEKEKIMNQSDSYITWVNSQLGKRDKSRHVKDLSKDMRDGVVFLQLVEVISDSEQQILDHSQLSINDMRYNLNNVLQFLSNNNVRVHHILPKEIIEGNLKTTMRLILALAAHFKPDSFNYNALNNNTSTPLKTNTSTPVSKSTKKKSMQRAPSLVSLASEAAASLAEASKNASKGGSTSRSSRIRKQQLFDSVPPKTKHVSQRHQQSSNQYQASKSFTMPSSSYHNRSESTPPPFERPKTLRGESCSAQTRPKSLRLENTQIPDLPKNVFKPIRNSRISVTEFPTDGSEIKTKISTEASSTNIENVKRALLLEDKLLPSSKSTDVDSVRRTLLKEDHTCFSLTSRDNVKRTLIPGSESEGSEVQDELTGLHDDLLEELSDAKDVMQQLQTVLMNGRTSEEMLGLESPRDESFQEQLVVKNIMLEQIENECADLRHQLNEYKEINMRLTNEKHGVELRFSQQEQLILSLKSKLLEHEQPNVKKQSEQQLQALLSEKNNEVQLLYDELSKRDTIIEKHKNELDSMSNDIVNKKRSEASLYAKLESSESMVSSLQLQLHEATENLHLQGNNTQQQRSNNFRVPQHETDTNTTKLQDAKIHRIKQKITREHHNLSTTLKNIKGNFPSNDPVQHAFQSIEHSLSSLMDSVSMLDVTKTQQKTQQGQYPSNKPQTINSSSHKKPHKTSDQYQRLSLPKHHSSRSTRTKSSISSDSGYDHTNTNNTLDASEQVKIVYFLGKSVTPILKSSDIGLGYLTLHDFKELVNRPGKYRYFFKSKDKDFGFVREELLYDEDLVPGYENKIVSWIEKLSVEEV